MNIITGRKPVLEAINSGEEVEQVFILYGQKGGIIDAIRIASKKRGIKCSEVKKERFISIASSTNTQGVAAAKSSFKFYSVEDIIANSKKSKYPLIVILDSIQDPHNVGAILRTAECAGAQGIIITKHNSASINQTVVKTSAGATEHLKISIINNLSQSLRLLKDNGFWIAGSSLEHSKNYSDFDYKIPIALIVGNEEKGIRRLTAENCDFLVKIPMKGEIQSLNVSVAAGILLFEILRQRDL
jgi:23S rRNA (guanosine2251-2'-O)-methyltransferase